MQGIEFIEEIDALKVCDVEIKNKWRFEWLHETDDHVINIGMWCRKIKSAVIIA